MRRPERTSCLDNAINQCICTEYDQYVQNSMHVHVCMFLRLFRSLSLSTFETRTASGAGGGAGRPAAYGLTAHRG